MHKKFGSLPFDTLLKEAINLCQKGFPVSKELSQSIARHKTSLKKQVAAENFYSSVKPFGEGEIL